MVFQAGTATDGKPGWLGGRSQHCSQQGGPKERRVARISRLSHPSRQTAQAPQHHRESVARYTRRHAQSSHHHQASPRSADHLRSESTYCPSFSLFLAGNNEAAVITTGTNRSHIPILPHIRLLRVTEQTACTVQPSG